VHLIDAEAAHFLIVEDAGLLCSARDAVGDAIAVESLDPLLRWHAPHFGAFLPHFHARRQRAEHRMQLLIAAQLTGVALAASEMAAEYAKVRVQFGKPIRRLSGGRAFVRGCLGPGTGE